MTVDLPSTAQIVLHFDPQAIRDHFEGCNRDDELDTVTDEQLRQAGEVVVSRLSERFWEAVDELFQNALDLANEAAEASTLNTAWADSFGVWHVRVSRNAAGPLIAARRVLRDELQARQGATVARAVWMDPIQVPELSTEDTIVYREGINPDDQD